MLSGQRGRAGEGELGQAGLDPGPHPVRGAHRGEAPLKASLFVISDFFQCWSVGGHHSQGSRNCVCVTPARGEEF